MKYTFSFILLVFVSLLSTACLKDDDDTQAVIDLPTLSISDVSQVEGNEGTSLLFTVRLTGFNPTNVGVRYITVDGTARSGTDFVGVTAGTLLFGPNETEKTIAINIVPDLVKEEDESFDVLLSDPVNATLANDRATGTLLNDDQSEGGLFIPPTGYTTPDNYPGMTLVWADEFEGSQLNPENWTHEIGTGNNGWGNNELQYYREENTYFVDGNLIIEARKEQFGGSEYTSSRLVTLGKQKFKYGRIDVRAALPEGQGLWPAIWMLGSNITQIGWPACGEIDIMELLGNQPSRVHGTVHFGANFSQHQFVGSSRILADGAKFSQEFHVFSLIWEENSIKWLLDDVEFNSFTIDDIGNSPYPFNKDFFFILNVAVGGDWPGNPDASTIFPQRMIVDYIRLFQ